MKIFKIISLLLVVNIGISQNINISEGVVFDGEPFIAVNPTNHNHIVVAWMSWKYNENIVIKTKVSFDGGNTWENETFIPHTQNGYTSADPSLKFADNGDILLSFIDYSGPGSSPVTGAIFVVKSTDNGISWNQAVEVIDASAENGTIPIDRPWINTGKTANNTSQTVYITSMNAAEGAAPYHPYFIKSTNLAESFYQWKHLDTTGFLSGNYIHQPMPVHCVGANGTFYAVYPSYDSSQNTYPVFILAKSNNAGVSFDYSVMFNSIHNISDSLAKKSYVICSDPTDTNHLAFLYLATDYGDVDVFIRESFDQGNSWSQAVRVNDDTQANNIMQDLLWADFDENGNIAACWRDRRNSGQQGYETASEIFASCKFKNSSNFEPNFTISGQIVEYDTILAYNGNDFMCVDFVNDTIYTVWGDVRTGKLNIWFAKYNTNGNLISKNNISERDIVNIYPNPFTETINIKTAVNLSKIEIYNTKGILIKQYNIQNKQTIQNINIPKAAYIVKIYSQQNKIIKTQKIIKK